jgi:hypothetical protein
VGIESGKTLINCAARVSCLESDTMQSKCEYSHLLLPNNRSYLSVARAYVRGVSRKLGFDDDERDMIDRAVAEAVENVSIMRLSLRKTRPSRFPVSGLPAQ